MKHKPGKFHVVPDTLSRVFAFEHWLAPTWGGPRTSARTSNGLAAASRVSSLGQGREGTLRSLTGELLTVRTARGSGDAFSFEAQRQGIHPYKSKAGTSPQRRALRVQPGEWRGWPPRGYAGTTGRTRMSALAGMAAPSSRKSRAYRDTKQRATIALLLKRKKKHKKQKKRTGRAARRLARKAAREAR